ncbi:hypothetical protein [Streptomyces sp. DT2A-34]|uniref:hypothetical protein n=1 Tax=Streptomyces sp. DT2A-34 TaxID=3051182 RepID=UPI003464D097
MPKPPSTDAVPDVLVPPDLLLGQHAFGVHQQAAQQAVLRGGEFDGALTAPRPAGGLVQHEVAVAQCAVPSGGLRAPYQLPCAGEDFGDSARRRAAR